MNVYLDDDRPTPAGFVGVDNVAEAKRLLLSGNVETLSLDNDLGKACKQGCWKEIVEGPNEMTERTCKNDCACPCHIEGYKLVLWMVENNIWPKEKPLVHSANTQRAPFMRELIEKYGPYK